MTTGEMISRMGLELMTEKVSINKEVTGGYASDLLSDVIAHSKKGNLWVTMQIHPNVVAVGTLKELAGIIIVNGRVPEKETVQKAQEEDIALMVTDLPSFEIIGRLWGLGIRGL